MATVSLAMIVKPSDDEAFLLDRCLASVAEHVDEIIIAITGENEAVSKVAEKYKAKAFKYEWNSDFAKARNFSFSKATSDYILWLDADDVLVGAKNLQEIVATMQKEKVQGAVAWYMYAFDEYGNITVRHKKVRLVENNQSFEWEEKLGELHEDLIPIYQSRTVLLQESEDPMYFEVHHLTNDVRVKGNSERNYTISKEQTEKYPNEPRAYWNLANSCMGLGLGGEAMDAFEAFVDLSGSEEEKYLALCRMAAILTDKQDAKALSLLAQAMYMKPAYPDAYIKMGAYFYGQRNWQKAKEFLVQGLSKEIPETIIVYNPRDYDENSLVLLCNSYMFAGKPEDALRVAENIVKMFPKHKKHEAVKKLLVKEVANMTTAKDFVKKSVKWTDEQFVKAYSRLPSEIKQNPLIANAKNTRIVKTKSSGKDMVIYCGFTEEEWGPASVEKGIGGSEESVINLSKRFKDLGWNVTVYNNCGPEEYVVDDVIWKPFWTFNTRDKQDVCILWRTPALLDHDINATHKFVDLHDVLPEREWTPRRIEQVDKIFVKSQFHRGLFPAVPDKKFVIISNGIDLAHFAGEEERVPNSMIYTSSPDRGLEHLLDMWGAVIKAVPDATLKVFYGWGVYDAVFKSDPVKMAWKKEMIEKMNQPGITNVGRVGHKEIAKEMMRTDIFAYPCHFEEIDCISMKKAIAASCTPITTNYAALGEYAYATPIEKGDWKDYEQVLIQELLSDNPPCLSAEANQWSWDIIAKKWNDVLCE